MKTTRWRGSVLALLGALSLAGCASLSKNQPAAEKASVPVKRTAAAAHTNTRPLFIIERNKNANIVRYDANFTADGKLDPSEPVVAYWVLLAGDGSRKKLNWVEKKMAYGVRLKPDQSPGGYTITLAAAPWLPLAVKKTGDAVRAEVAINGRPAVLAKIFIQARERLLGPKVEYVELYGKDLRTGEDCREKIIPK